MEVGCNCLMSWMNFYESTKMMLCGFSMRLSTRESASVVYNSISIISLNQIERDVNILC